MNAMVLPDEQLDKWRKRIDEIDGELVRLLNERAECAEEIGRIKKQLGLEAYSPAREQEVMQNVTRANAGPLSGEAVRRLFERIIDESRAVERTLMDRMHPRKSSIPPH